MKFRADLGGWLEHVPDGAETLLGQLQCACHRRGINGIALYGYRWNPDPQVEQTIVFFPAFPILMRLCATLVMMLMGLALTAQMPLGGSRLRRGGEVHASLATAPASPTVPKVAGLALADVFDALTTHRPYRPPFSPEEALRIMRDDVGAFDPMLFPIFEQLVPSFQAFVAAAVKAENEPGVTQVAA